jgi:hypothetical protein
VSREKRDENSSLDCSFKMSIKLGEIFQVNTRTQENKSHNKEKIHCWWPILPKVLCFVMPHNCLKGKGFAEDDLNLEDYLSNIWLRQLTSVF